MSECPLGGPRSCFARGEHRCPARDLATGSSAKVGARRRSAPGSGPEKGRAWRVSPAVCSERCVGLGSGFSGVRQLPPPPPGCRWPVPPTAVRPPRAPRPGPHLWPPFASPRRAGPPRWTLQDLGLRAPTAGLSPSAPFTSERGPLPRRLRASHPSRAPVRPGLPSGWRPPLPRPPASPLLPSRPRRSIHPAIVSRPLLPSPPLPRRPPPPPLPRRGLKEPMGRRRQVSLTCTTWGRGKGRAGRATSQNRKAFSHCARLPGVQPCSGFFS